MAQQQQLQLRLRTATTLLVVLLVTVTVSVSELVAPAAAAALTGLKGGGGDLVTAAGAAAVVVMRRGGRTCRRGTVGECMEYFGVDAEAEGDLLATAGGSTRRVLQQQGGGSGYIGYDALRRDSVPCAQRGASYYNCQPGAEANPYSRGCSAIAQCRG